MMLSKRIGKLEARRSPNQPDHYQGFLTVARMLCREHHGLSEQQFLDMNFDEKGGICEWLLEHGKRHNETHH